MPRPRSLCLLAAALALTAIMASAPAGALDAQTMSPPEYQRLAREIFEELVGINTTHSAGSTTIAAEAMAVRLRAEGIPDEDIHIVEPAPRKGNLVVRYRGRAGGGEPILLMAHLDVVEANPEDWTLPPFELIEEDSTFYGRGTSDDKDEAAIYVVNLIRMKREGFVPDRDIIVALTADEEGGPDNGVRWLVENRRDLINAGFALNEGGGGSLADDVRVSNNVQASEKKVLNVRVEVTNPGGHSSRPRPDNAIYQLSAALVKIGEHNFPVNLNEVTREFFRKSADLVDPAMGAAMRAVLANPADAEAVARVATQADYNARLRTTCVATVLDGGHATNALPQRAGANVNCRILPDESPEDVRRALERAVGDPAVTITPVTTALNSPPSPLAPEVLEPIQRITEQMWPGVPVVPTMSTGATDGMYLRNAGIPVYGVSGLFYGDTFAHGMNERIPVRSFYEGQEFLYRLVRALTSRGVS